MARAYIGVDVGTGSARAGIFGAAGALIASAKQPIAIWRDAGGIVEHSSADIWAAVTQAVRDAVALAALPQADFAGIGFDATCSLVMLDAAGAPLSVSPNREAKRDVIVWMDHRATREADLINAGGHDVLRYVGGAVSPEMQMPKLAWLAKHMPEQFAKAEQFLDLTDFLTQRASGSTARSLCTVTCKFTYLAHENRWAGDFFESIGLGRLADDRFRRIGDWVVAPGSPLGAGLSPQVAAAMGLPPGLPVGAGLIDAHAGAVGTMGATLNGAIADPRRRLALILGTSACCMALADEARFIKGVWGPYFSVLTPNQWLTEGGQSAFGAAIDHLMRMHPAFAEFSAKGGGAVFETMERDLVARAGGLSAAALLGKDLHVLPDFLGNRSPFADPNMRGAIVGLDLRDDYVSLCELYVAGLTALAHSIAQIIRSLEQGGFDFDMLVVSGGAGRSALVRQMIADACGKPVSAPHTPEPVLLGAAMLGAVAAGHHNLPSAMTSMSTLAEPVKPAGGAIAAFHANKRQAFELLQRTERDLRALTNTIAPRRPQLVIFDCDGVLVDSERMALEEMRRASRKAGVELTPDEAIDRFLGKTFESSMQMIEAEFGANPPPGFRADVAAKIMRRLEKELTGIEGVREAVGGVDARVCVASSSGLKRIDLSLKVAGIEDIFGADVFSAQMVARGKPHPDLFLYAATRMASAPADCLVIEDSVPGVQAAVAAKMRVFGFVGGAHISGDGQAKRLIEAGAELIFDDMRQLPALIAGAASRPRQAAAKVA